MRWQTKAWAFSMLSKMPFGEDIHYALQRYVTRRLPRPEKQVRSIHALAERLIGVYEKYSSVPLHESTCFEFGAGRDLIVPLSFSAHGAYRFITEDIERLAKLPLVRSNAAIVARLGGINVPDLSSLEDLQRWWRIDYRAPADARATGLPTGSIDCAISVETLEHIPREDIAAILKELRRIVSPGGLIIMLIDYGDHFKGFDPSISSFNFLTYSEKDWAPFQSRFQYVNRLRHSQYLQLIREAGFDLLSEEPDRRPPERQILQRLAPCFSDFSEEDLFTLGALIVGRSPGPSKTIPLC